MNIKYKIPIYAGGGQSGIRYTSTDPNGWRNLVFSQYRQHILDQLAQSGEANDYGFWLNDMQSRHSKLYNAANATGDWRSIAYRSDDVGRYQQDYRGGIGNDGTYQRYGSIQLPDSYRNDFNQSGIKNAQENKRYDFFGPQKRLESDRGASNYKIDNLYSGITDDRRLLGRKGDWDENSDEFKQWQADLNARGWETYLDTDDYYKLRRLPNPEQNPGQNPQGQNPQNLQTQISTPQTEVPEGHKDKYGFDWKAVGEGFQKILGNPDLYAFGRLAGNLINNERVYNEQLKGINPVLKQSYYTGRQVVGDEATKQAYYKRAAAGQTKAARPFTSDADRQMAYQMEAKRIGDELRAQGDLADNGMIRDTSNESNQHQWANTQRNTEVANYNIASINQAKSLKHNLLAQKHSAQWSSVDNFLKGIEYRKRQRLAEEQALDDQIFALNQQYELLNDERITNSYKELQALFDKHTDKNDVVDYENDEVKAAIKKHKALQLQLAIESYNKKKDYYRRRGLISYGKEGTKIKVTRKRKEDLLYKSAKDVVEHFQKMSKLSSDAQNRKQPKIEKLADHPKGKTRKYQQGGVAPFTIYTPVALGGETSTSTSSSVSSDGLRSGSKGSKDNSEKETLDLIKELFKQVAGKGLPVDVNTIYKSMSNLFKRYQAFGEEMDTNDIALLYLQSMQQLNGVLHSKDVFDKAKAEATKNEALGEFAVTADGQYVVQDKDGKIDFATLDEIKKNKLNPITNQQLLNLRAYSPELLLGKGDYVVDNVINNGMGLNKIAERIKSLAGSIGSSDEKIEGITKVESDKIKAGLKELAEAPEGHYKITQQVKNSKSQVALALQFIENSLSPSQKAILDIHSGGNNKALIASFLGSQVSDSQSFEIDPLTGKAAKDANGNSKESNSSIKASFNDLVQRGQIGVPREFSLITRDENTKLYSLDSRYISQLPNVDTDMSIDRMLAESEVGKILDSRLGITFGDQVINPQNLKDIMFSVGGGATVVTLPCKYENGHKVVNFAIKDQFDDAIKEASKIAPVDWTDPKFKNTLASILKEKGLDSLLTGDMQLDPNMLGQFMVVEAYSTDRVNFNKNSKYIEKVSNPDKALEERLNNALSVKGPDGKVKKYGVDINDWGLGFLFEGGWDDIYHANVFIPLNNDPISAQIGNDTLKRDDARKLASEYQNYQKLINAKSGNSNQLL